MYALERPPHLRYAALTDVRSPRIRELHDYWKSRCSDVAPPPRSAIEPADIRALLPHLTLAELTAAPLRIVYRLVGTAVARIHGDDFTGRDHDSVASLAESGLEAPYRRMLECKAPVFGRTGLYAGDHSWIGFEYALLPLSDDGVAVNKCLGIQWIDPSAAAGPEARPPEEAAPSVRRGRPRALATPAEQAQRGQAGRQER